MAKLSIIVLSYNTSAITSESLQSLVKSLESTSFNSEIIVVDNASSDGSVEMIKKFEKEFVSKTISIITIFNQQNVGYPKGNNQGVKVASGEYILFLNSDVTIQHVNWNEVLTYLDENTKVGTLTVRVELSSGNIDQASHRGFPTVWNAFSYYSGLEKFTQSIPGFNKVFGGYHLKHLDLHTTHAIDSPSGAFFLTRKQILSSIGGFDEAFFMYGEDLDLAFRIKEAGYEVIYYPHSVVLHLKYQSGLQKKQKKTQGETRNYFYNAMKIFYQKHYEKQNPFFINHLVYLFIDLKQKLSK